MNKIDTNLHKPIIFLNGTKYKLDKAYTFVNGVKQQIWGESGVQIDYISSTGVLGGGTLFAIGENWANVCANNKVLRLNISNISSPTLVQDVVWGEVKGWNGYQSTQNSVCFETWNTSTRTANKMQLDPSDGTMQVIQTASINATSSSTNSATHLGATNTALVGAFNVLQTLQPSQTWQQNFYWNGIYSYRDNSVSSLYKKFIQVANDSLICINGSNGMGRFTSSGHTSLGTLSGGSTGAFYDNGIVYNCSNPRSAGNYITTRSGADMTTVLNRYDAGDGYTLKMLGMIDGYIYLLKMPYSSSAANPEIKLLLLDSTDMTTVVHQKTLPVDPFNENNGAPTFWRNCEMVPQVSQTGFVGVSTYNSSTLDLRIVRFSTIF